MKPNFANNAIVQLPGIQVRKGTVYRGGVIVNVRALSSACRNEFKIDKFSQK